MKFLIKIWKNPFTKAKILLMFIGLLVFSTVLIFNSDRAIAGYSQCKTNNQTNVSPYCFKKGNSGSLIKTLVEDLRTAGYYQGKTTQIFNTKVEQSVKKFQQDYRQIKGSLGPVLKVDGVVGSDTLSRLCQAIGRGCNADADASCYTGSPRMVTSCLDKYK